MPRWGQLSRMAKTLPSSLRPSTSRDAQEHCGGHLPSPEGAATHRRIPVVVDEGRVWPQQIAQPARPPDFFPLLRQVPWLAKTCTYYSAMTPVSSFCGTRFKH